MHGFASVRFEGNALYLYKEDYEMGNRSNAVWLQFKDFTEEMDKDQSYVFVEGIFEKDSRGHLGLFAGTLKYITRFDKITPH